MGLYSGGLIIGIIFASEFLGAYFREGLFIYLFIFFFLGGGGAGGAIIRILRYTKKKKNVYVENNKARKIF